MAVTIGIQQFANDIFSTFSQCEGWYSYQGNHCRTYSAEHCCHPWDVHKLMEEESYTKNDEERGGE